MSERRQERLNEYHQLALESNRLKIRMLDFAERLDRDFESQHLMIYPLVEVIGKMGKLQDEATRLIKHMKKAEHGALYED